jgi:hypothetical protein
MSAQSRRVLFYVVDSHCTECPCCYMDSVWRCAHPEGPDEEMADAENIIHAGCPLVTEKALLTAASRDCKVKRRA